MALDWGHSEAWDGTSVATGGGTSSQGASTQCFECCIGSAGGCTNSHTQTELKTCLVLRKPVHYDDEKQDKRMSPTTYKKVKSCREVVTNMLLDMGKSPESAIQRF